MNLFKITYSIIKILKGLLLSQKLIIIKGFVLYVSSVNGAVPIGKTR